MKQNQYEKITDRVLTLMDEHGADWLRPFAIHNPHNVISGKDYRGINILMTMLLGGGDTEFATFKQWSDKGCKIRKGSKGVPILFFKMLEKENEKTGEIDQIPMAKGSTVFGASQVEGYEPKTIESENQVQDFAEAERIVKETGAEITVGQPCYIPKLDQVHMPVKSDFSDTDTSTATEAYYSTLFHELGHWTMHKTRLNRKHEYAMEELVAELTAVFCCVKLGISPEPRADHAKYLNAWKKHIKDNPKAIYNAARDAQKATDYIFGEGA